MANIRNRVTANNDENNGENNNQDANPPPPTPPTLDQVLPMQTQMLQAMQQTMVNLHVQPQAPPLLRDRLGDFQCTMPDQWKLPMGRHVAPAQVVVGHAVRKQAAQCCGVTVRERVDARIQPISRLIAFYFLNGFKYLQSSRICTNLN
jgi:hypothetical protein